MQHNFSLVFALLLVAISVVNAQYYWTSNATFVITNAAANETKTIMSYSSIQYPIYSALIRPQARGYMVVSPAPDSPVVDVCLEGFSVAKNFPKFSCESFFCSGQPANISHLVSEDVAYLYNYCYYCSNRLNTENSSVTWRQDFISFNSRLRFNASACRGWDQDYFDMSRCERPFSFKHEKYDDPRTMCFCENVNRYGGFCDAYTDYFIISFNFARPWILFAINVVVALVVFLIVCLPECVMTVRAFMGFASDQKCSRKCFLKFTTNRIQIILFLFLSVVFLSVEYIVSFAINFYGFKRVREVFVSNTFRIVSILCVVACYSALLVFWASIMDSGFQKRRLGACHIVVLSIFYVIFALLVILVAALSPVKAAQTALYGIIAGIGLIYLIIFPCGLSIYAIRIYITLKRAQTSETNKIKITDLKMIRFLLVTNVMFALLTIMAIIGVAMSIAGWDIMGEWIGIHRTIFIDLVLMIIFLMIVYLTYWEKPFMALYGNCLVKIGLKKVKSHEQAEEEYREEKPRRRKKIEIDEEPTPVEEQSSSDASTAAAADTASQEQPVATTPVSIEQTPVSPSMEPLNPNNSDSAAQS